MGFISKLFGKDKKPKRSKDSYLHSELVYSNDAISLTFTNQEKEMEREEKIRFIEDNAGLADVLFIETSNIIILLDFSLDYMADAAEFLSSGIIPAKFAQGGYEKELDEVDTHGDKKSIYIPKYYILIGGTIENYLDLFRFTPNLSNPFIQAIKKELCNGVHKCFFRELIYDGVFREEDFHSSHVIYENYKIEQTEAEQDIVSIISYDPIDVILKKLPDAFTGEDLLYFTKINMLLNRRSEQCAISTNLNIAIINNLFFSNDGDNVVNTLIDIIFREKLYDSVFKNITMEKLQQLTMPVYRRALNPEDSIFGKVSDEAIDEIFKVQYDKFTGIIKNDEDIIYEGVDEVVGDDVKPDREEKEDE